MVIQGPVAGDPHAHLMLRGIEEGTGRPSYRGVPGLRPGQDAPALSQQLAAQLIALGSKPIRTIWQVVHSRILLGPTSPERSKTQRPR